MDDVICVVLIITGSILIVAIIIWFVCFYNNGNATGTYSYSLAETKKIPEPPSVSLNHKYVVEFINKSPEILLLGIYGPTQRVLPRKKDVGKWTLEPNTSIVLDIPNEWLGDHGDNYPKFWVRTGCRFNAKDGMAQCESGDCNNKYNCDQLGKQPVSLAEFCFDCKDNNTVTYSVDISKGYNLSINIIPIGGSETDPSDETNTHWNVTNLCDVEGNDLRALCPPSHQLKSNQLQSFIPGSENNIVSCFSNCGKASYPRDPDSDDKDYYEWKKYCCTGNSNNKNCQCHGWTLETTCSQNVCTYQNEHPPYKQCEDCVGDDTFHLICPFAKSWPQDNQKMFSNAKVYQVIFSQGGTNVPITSSSDIPKCESLPDSFKYKYIKNELIKNTYYILSKTNGYVAAVNSDNTTNGVLCHNS
jgi:hypothetical protein